MVFSKNNRKNFGKKLIIINFRREKLIKNINKRRIFPLHLISFWIL